MNPIDINQAYIQHKTEITNYIYGFLKHKQDAEDLAQDCFVRLIQYHVDIPQDRILYLLKRIARNLAIDEFRKNTTRSLIRSSKLELPTYHCDTSTLEIEEGVDDLISLIANTEHRRILKLRIIHGYSVKETAQFMNRTESMVKSSLFHAVNKIRSKVSSL